MSKQPRTVDLTISLDGLDTEQLLSNWRWIVPESFQPIHLTKFGDWFLSGTDGRIHHLDLIEGTLLQVANSHSHFDALLENEDTRYDLFLAGFVFRCDAEGLLLKDGECYGWRVHPMIGGKFEFANIQVFSLAIGN